MRMMVVVEFEPRRHQPSGPSVTKKKRLPGDSLINPGSRRYCPMQSLSLHRIVQDISWETRYVKKKKSWFASFFSHPIFRKRPATGVAFDDDDDDDQWCWPLFNDQQIRLLQYLSIQLCFNMQYQCCFNLVQTVYFI